MPQIFQVAGQMRMDPGFFLMGDRLLKKVLSAPLLAPGNRKFAKNRGQSPSAPLPSQIHVIKFDYTYIYALSGVIPYAS